MADRRVRRTGKDSDGDITSLCNSGQAWSPRSKAGAISDIDGGVHTYFVEEDGRADIIVVNAQNGKHLRTKPDSGSKNNLDNLPDC